MKGKQKKFNTPMFLVMSLNILVIIFIIIMCFIYISTVQKESRKQTLSNFSNAVGSLDQTSNAFMMNNQNSVNDWAHYINSKQFSVQEALAFLNELSTSQISMIHLIKMETLKGFSTVSDMFGDNTIDYSDLSDLFTEEKSQDHFGKTINISNMYTNPTNGLPSISFSQIVWLWEDDKPVSYYLLRVNSREYVKQTWTLPLQFQKAEISLIKRNGDYIIRSNSLKSSNFWEYMRIYNNLTYTQNDKLKLQMLNSNKPVPGKDSKGRDAYFCCCPNLGKGDWCFIGYLPAEEIKEYDINWKLVVFISIGFFILLALDAFVFININIRLKKSNNETLEANLAKTKFLSSMSHDIRTPLNAIIGMTTIASKHIREPEKIKDCLNKIEFSGTHLLTLVNDVLDISKIETGHLNIVLHSVSIQELIRNLESVGNILNNEKNLEFEVICKNIKYPRLIADELRLNQIFINLLTNAFKYTPDRGQVSVSFEELPNTSDSESVKLIFTISDTGIGMDSEFQKHMYDAFTRSVDSRIDQVQGSGLGLTITKQMVELMNGSIHCKSVEGVGTRFTVILPLTIDKTSPNIDARPDDSENKGRFFGVHLLVAEDNDLNWEILNEILRMNSISADRAENGQICLEMLSSANEEDYDAILMDIQMPVMNGHEAARKIREMDSPKKQIPIIAMTADAFPEDIKACLDSGMNAHISKPIDMKKLFNELRKYF